MKPYAESCDQNREPILAVLRDHLSDKTRLLEIGSGTGQHAVYFAPQFPRLIWQTSDLPAMLAGIDAWLDEAAHANTPPPVALEVCSGNWPDGAFDAVFSANTAHIMSWTQVECMFAGVGRVLKDGGVFCLYGPFNYDGRYTSESNAQFDQWLRNRDPASGVRDFEALNGLAEAAGLVLAHDHAMPANNRTLIWTKPAPER